MLYVLRFAIILLFMLSGYQIGLSYDAGAGTNYALVGLAAGLTLGIIALLAERAFKGLSMGPIIGGIIGISLGLAAASLIIMPLKTAVPEGHRLFSFVIQAVLGYGGLLIGMKKGEKLTVPRLFRMFRGEEAEEHIKLLDTSVIIDGRIADICDTGFIEGTFILPQFILQELQHVADSPDPLKRARGRRGLDVLHRMQKTSRLDVKIVEDDFPKIREVDAKLVALAKVMNGKVITNDFNLNKVAELQGVSVLNINELANAIKPVVLPGETIKIFIIKEGKEMNQGVAYLDDGTMVVVDNGRRLIGKNVEVTVTSVLQTTAGRMIFTKSKEDYEREELKAAR